MADVFDFALIGKRSSLVCFQFMLSNEKMNCDLTPSMVDY